MSMEQAILELAAGVKELAAAVRGVVGTPPMPLALTKLVSDIENDDTAARAVKVSASEKLAAADLRNSDEYKKLPSEDKQPVTESQELAAAEKAAEVKPDAELDAAAAKVEEDSKPLDYAKDVQPKLLAFVRAKGRAAMAQLLVEYEAQNAAKMPPEQWPAMLADVEKLMAE